jgi:general secretion pathway protein F
MPRFAYRALKQTGTEIRGEVVADTAQDAALTVQKMGSFPIEISTAPTVAAPKLRLRRDAAIPARDLALFTRQLASLVGSGIPIDRALALISADHRQTRKGRLAEELASAIAGGESLSQAAAERSDLPRHYAMVIAAGEATGDIGAALDRLATILERDRAIAQSLSNALIYPASVLVVAVASVLFLLGFVVPQFSTLLTSFHHRPSLMLEILLGASAALHSYGLFAFLLIAAGVAAFLVRRRNSEFRLTTDRRLLSVPFLGPILVRVQSERLTLLLGHLLAAGVAVPAAIAAARRAMSNEAFRTALAAAEAAVERGERISTALKAADLLPEFTREFVQVGEETGNLAPLLLKASDILRREVEAATTELLSLITPVTMVVLGLLIGFIAFAIFGAVMEIYDIAA